MRLLADENIPLETVRALRNAGHDVFAASEAAPGLADEAHLDRARNDISWLGHLSVVDPAHIRQRPL
jgi:hypothetical protein